jgi:hypothetical protein
MTISPNFAYTPAPGCVAISTNNANKDGTGTLATVYTVPSAYTFTPSPVFSPSSGAWVIPTTTTASVPVIGWRCDRVRAKATGTTVAGAFVLYLHNGTTAFPITEVAITAGTDWERTIEFATGLNLPPGWSIRASYTTAQSGTSIIATAEGGLY